jgi:hypothetical protein
MERFIFRDLSFTDPQSNYIKALGNAKGCLLVRKLAEQLIFDDDSRYC